MRLAGTRAFRPFVTLVALATIGLTAPWSAWAASRDMLARGSQWITVKAGMAKSAVEDAPDGNVGFGVTYSYFFRSQMSVAAAIQYDVLGRYQGPAEVEIPVTVEGTYHFRWPTQAMPYAGLGTGYAFHSYKYTGADEQETRWMGYLLGGMDFPVAQRALLGFDLRMAFETGGKSENPWFPSTENTVMHWGWKLTYSYGF